MLGVSEQSSLLYIRPSHPSGCMTHVVICIVGGVPFVSPL